jgi:hypothetical protein
MAPSFRRSYIGTELLQAYTGEFVGRQTIRAIAEIHPDNRVGEAFLRRQGFDPNPNDNGIMRQLTMESSEQPPIEVPYLRMEKDFRGAAS